MNKLLLGLSILLSVVLLSGCGSGSKGSAGADGAAGAKGDTGATGASGSAGTSSGLTDVLVPSADTDLAITASTTVDSDVTLGQVARTFTLSGTDNESAASTLRYYGYFGKSSSTKNVHAVSGTSSTNSIGQTMPLDTRHKASGGDNYTLTLTADQNLGDGDGSITHMIICPGNYAGDATSCASAAINDRGAASSLVSAAGDNVTIVNFVTGLTVVRASNTDNVDVDTLTVPSTKDVAVVDSGTLKSAALETGSQAPGVMQIGVTDTYIIGLGDNSTSMKVIDHTSSSLTTGVTNHQVSIDAGSRVSAITDVSASEGYNSVHYAVLQSADDNMTVYTVSSSGSLSVFNDNVTIDSDLLAGADTARRTNSVQHCSAANPYGAQVVTAHFWDNATVGMTLTSYTASSVSQSFDNGSERLITAADSADNGTFGTSCAAAWAADGLDGGSLFIAYADNATGYEVCVSLDNGSSCGSTIVGPNGGTGNGAHMAITTDPETYQPIVAFNKAGRVYVDRYDNSTTTWETLIDSGASFAATTDTVSVTTSGDDHIIVATQGATADNSTVILFYDE